MSPFGPSFLPQPAVYSQPFDFVGPLFSYSYELLFPQPLCFDNDLNCPGGGPISLAPCLCAGACPDPVGAANPMFSEPCSLFVVSLRSFLHSFPLFSRAWSLFCQNTRGGGLLRPFSPLVYPERPLRRATFAFSDYRECASGDACWAEEEGVARRALKASFMRVRMMRRFWAMLLAHAKRPI